VDQNIKGPAGFRYEISDLFIFGFVKITPNIHNLINYKAIAGSHDNQIELLD